MRLVTYESNKRSTPRSGRVDGKWLAGIAIEDRVVDSLAAAKVAKLLLENDTISNRDIIQWTPDQQSQLEKAAHILANSSPSADVLLRPPIPDPDKIICLGLNYRRHAEEAGLPLPEVPSLFAKYRNSLTGPTSPIVLPGMSDK